VGSLPALHPEDLDPIEPGQIYCAPPDRHLLVREGRIRITRGPRENHFRPAIDALFRSAARSYGERTVGVILSGALYDGVAGLMAVRAAGGVAVVQEPTDAVERWLPQYALDVAGADHVVPLAQMGQLLTGLVRQPLLDAGGEAMADTEDPIVEAINSDQQAAENGQQRGRQSFFTCPECGGVMWQSPETELSRFQCHTGHSFLGEQLLIEQREQLEAALWTAVRIFRERAVLSRALSMQESQRNPRRSERFEEQATLADQYADLIQQRVIGNTAPKSGESTKTPSAD
jgi:two-component system chemotaxis response regulator CheB